ncbi:MAG: DNA alkylation repair protein [Sphingobium sp.]|nr:DNA alkylation repair protein [Sphingobium sp.]
MTVDEALARLEAFGSEQIRALAARHGVPGVKYGVKMGDIRIVAKAIKADHALGLALWETGIFEARLLAILVMKPKALSAEALDRLIRSNETPQVSDWLNSYILKAHPEKEALREAYMAPGVPPIAARAGWSLTAERIAKSPAKDAEALDLPALLDRIERELAGAHPLPQWTMNNALAAIGIHHPEHRARALAIGEALGVYRDYPTPKGCTSPFAPIWINEMVRRQG